MTETSGSELETAKVSAIVEAALLAADEPLTVDRLEKLFAAGELDAEDPRGQLRAVLKAMEEEAAQHGYELKRVASGYRFQVRQELSPWVSRLWDEKPPRYSRALLETLALIAYKQPVTRGDIEQVRGVSVSQNIMRTLLERGWIRVVGQREVPGRPAMYGTTRLFLDYFNLKSLGELPPLAEIRELVETIAEQPEELPAEGTLAAPEVTLEVTLEVESDAGAAGSDPAAAAAAAEAEAEAEDSQPTREAEERVSAEVVPLPTAPQSRS